MKSYDLHKYSYNAACEEMKKMISTWKQAEIKYDFYIITGKGNNSEGGKSILRPLVKERLKKNGIKYCEPENNTGRIYIRGGRRYRHIIQYYII